MFYICSECSKVRKYGYVEDLDYLPLGYRGACLKTYDKIFHEYLCGEDDCNGGMYLVDELMLPTIIELNEKGYKTKFSCSGHLWDEDGHRNEVYETHLVFRDNEMELPPPPPSFYYVNLSKFGQTAMYLHDKIQIEDSVKYAQRHIMEVNYELLQWAISLPERK